MSSKRAACDRCHKMKMQCKADECSGECVRYRTAKVHCNYSKPRKPGRPSTSAGSVLVQGVSANAELTKEASLPPKRGSVDDKTWMQDFLLDDGILQGTWQFTEAEIESWPSNGSFDGYPDTPCLQLVRQEPSAAKSWPFHIIPKPSSSPSAGNFSMHETARANSEPAQSRNPYPLL